MGLGELTRHTDCWVSLRTQIFAGQDHIPDHLVNRRAKGSWQLEAQQLDISALASKEEDHLDPFIPSSHSTNIGWNEWWAWRQPGWWRTCLGLGAPRNSKVSTWGYREHSAGDSALLVPLALCNPGDCQINDKTHFTSRPEVCSGEPKLIAYLILSHQSLIQASTNKSVLHFGSEGLMEWAFPRALVYHESLLRGTWPSWDCGQSDKKAWELRFWGWPLGSEKWWWHDHSDNGVDRWDTIWAYHRLSSVSCTISALCHLTLATFWGA